MGIPGIRIEGENVPFKGEPRLLGPRTIIWTTGGENHAGMRWFAKDASIAGTYRVLWLEQERPDEDIQQILSEQDELLKCSVAM